jgi:hypothetical protein
MDSENWRLGGKAAVLEGTALSAILDILRSLGVGFPVQLI